MLLLAILVFGLAVGWVAQLIVGGDRRPDGQALVAGLIGSFVGGLIGSLLAGDGLALRPSGLIGSLVGAVLVLMAFRRFRGGAGGKAR